tara:strand:- start:60 stop:518 length:459 start_codon:yes stop_codon:yes gene_type:complete
MVNKITNFVFLILLVLLQSCSGGKIGNFLESSFNNNSNKTAQNDINKKLKSNKIFKDKNLAKKEDKITKITTNNDTKILKIVNKSSIKSDTVNTVKGRNQNFQPKSYRVFVILKKVDPSSPTENFSKVLRDGDINFEIEKIELMSELTQNKK